MAKVRSIITAFNAGEASPLLYGRVDFQNYSAMGRRVENFLPLVQGALRRRPGTAFVRAAKGRCVLVPFEFNVEQAYVLEIGDEYLRIHLNHGTLLDGGLGVDPLELVTPWAVTDLFAADGTGRLRWAQSNDVMYLACSGYPVQTLQRLGATSWTLTPLVTKNGPMKDQNIDREVTVYVSGTSGSVTLTASAAIFEAGHVGALFYLEMRDGRDLRPWESGQNVSVGDFRLSDEKIYRCTALTEGRDVKRTGSIKPVHTFGRQWDGLFQSPYEDYEGGAEWEFISTRYGIVTITDVSSGFAATGDVTGDWDLPAQVVGAANYTWRWAHAAYSDVEGWPSQVAWFRNRLVLARDARIDMSVAADYENFAAKDYGDVTADMAVAIEVQSDRANVAQWLAPANALLFGTAGGEFVISEQTTTEAFGPTNVKAVPQTQFGSRGIVPPRVGNVNLFVARGGRKIRAAAYTADQDAYDAPDQTWISEHLTIGGGIVQLAYQAQPDSIVWAVTADGRLLAFTFDAAQKVYAWAPQPIAGAVEAIAVIPAPDGDGDELWLSVKRTIDDVEVRHVEYLTKGYRTGDDRASVWYVDAGLSRTGEAVEAVSGLDHLESETVTVVVDGATHPDRVVAGGAIDLDWPAETVLVGLAAPAYFEPMTLEAGARMGTAQGATQRINKVTLRLHETGGGAVGPDADHLDPIFTRSTEDAMDAAPPLFSGDFEILHRSGYDGGARFLLACEDAQPCTLIAAIVDIATYE